MIAAVTPSANPSPFRLLVLALCAPLLLLSVGCAAPPPRNAVIDRLSPEALAALPAPQPQAAAEATRLTRQADREAQAAREARRRAEVEWQARHDWERDWHGSFGLGIGRSYPDWRWGSWYGYPGPFFW